MTASVLPPLIEQMLKPEFYPHSVTLPVQLIQTHISFVLLTGDYAYKIKKAVDLGFLDFSTLDKRRHFCREELRLNQRTSPELYLKVLPISVSKSGEYRFVPEDSESIVEYALQMRQFPQEALFSKLFEEGKLNENHLRDLADLVATLHKNADSSEEIRRYGTPEAIRDVAEKNYDLTRPFIGRVQTQAQFDFTKNYTDTFLSENIGRFRERQAKQKIRECHGDLHLNNVCLYENDVHVFDCIEFAPQFRNIDVIYDVAFMVMDLEFRSRPDLANVFLNHYLEQTGDYEGAILLRFYCSLRATVRAKVQSLILLEDTVPQQEKDLAEECARRYYRFAATYGKPHDGRLVLMSGLSGSGKTTVARKLAAQLSAIHIRSDAVRKSMEDTSELYSPERTRKTYHRLAELGILLASNGVNVILDAKYDRVEHRSHLIDEARKQNIALKIYYCTAPLDVLRERLKRRTADLSDATPDLLDRQLREAEPFTAAERPFVRIINTSDENAAI